MTGVVENCLVVLIIINCVSITPIADLITFCFLFLMVLPRGTVGV
jgi:hypothetical protein